LLEKPQAWNANEGIGHVNGRTQMLPLTALTDSLLQDEVRKLRTEAETHLKIARLMSLRDHAECLRQTAHDLELQAAILEARLEGNKRAVRAA
jgi:hypothetical protein